jgi:diaminopimelate epimerase
VPVCFSKLQAAGNAYVVVDGREDARDWSRLAIDLGDPRFGVGCDGLAVAECSDLADIRMRIFNTDGSEAEMSGNGIRLFAKAVLDRGMVSCEGGSLRIETGAGIRDLTPLYEAGVGSPVRGARVAMGRPELEAARIPVREAGIQPDSIVFDHPLEVAGEALRVTCLSVGNPHAVAIADGPVEVFDLERLGPLVQTHPAFPNRINFEVIQRVDRNSIRARIFERGEGETLASGTGSTAAVVAARLHGWVDDRVEVRLPGGVLTVEWDGEGEAWLEGPATHVFDGVWPD